MSRRESLTRLNLIINRLRKRPASFEEISQYLERQSELEGYNYSISKRTFQRDLDEIRSLYQIEIKYNNRLKVYRVEDDEQDEAQSRIMEAFDTLNVLNIHDRIAQYIYFEKRRPQGTHHLYGLLHAIKNNFLVSFDYQKYWENENLTRNVEPYALKEFRYRWYLMAKDHKDGVIKSFGLDRMANLDINRQKFVLPDSFNIDLAYNFCFGIIQPDYGSTPQDILLSFDPVQGEYIKSLPLHSTQEVVLESGSETRVALHIYITYDFLMELMSYGNRVRVLQPPALAASLREMHREAMQLYSA
jgi:predicted DNA-binding transcriptional regulator YafY